jgi:hypothetical protein
MANKKRKKVTHIQRPSQGPVVHHYTAVSRGPLMRWWHEQRRFITTITVAVLIVLAVGWLIFEAASRLF